MAKFKVNGTASTASNEQPKENHSLSPVGIVIIAAVVIIVAIVCIFIFAKKKEKEKTTGTE